MTWSSTFQVTHAFRNSGAKKSGYTGNFWEVGDAPALRVAFSPSCVKAHQSSICPSPSLTLPVKAPSVADTSCSVCSISRNVGETLRTTAPAKRQNKTISLPQSGTESQIPTKRKKVFLIASSSTDGV